MRLALWLIIPWFFACASSAVDDHAPSIDPLAHFLTINSMGGVDAEYAPARPIYTGSLPDWSETVCRDELKDLDSFGEPTTWSIDRVMRGFDQYAQARRQVGKQPRIMLFLHGGLVSNEDAFAESSEILDAIGETPDFYPIFVNWESGIRKSYVDHLLYVRNGERVHWANGLLFSWAVALADLGRALGRMPVFLREQYRHVFGSARGRERFVYRMHNGQPRFVPEGWEDSVQLPDVQAKGSLPQGYWVKTFVPGAARLVTSPVLDFAGTGAYENMLRRSRLLFLLDTDFRQMRHRPCGSLSRLMDEIRAYELVTIKGYAKRGSRVDRTRGDDVIARLRGLQTQRRALPVSPERRDVIEEISQLEASIPSDVGLVPVTVIAHSMGGVVTDELLNRNDDLYFDNVVYMAAANTIKEFASLALPYLEANPSTRFYGLTLHPFREVREMTAQQSLPEGSLLTWLDRYLIPARSKLDRTFGTWNNLAEALTLIQFLEKDTRDRLIIRVGDLSNRTPQKHGDFNDPPRASHCGETCFQYRGARFWESSYWQIDPAGR